MKIKKILLVAIAVLFTLSLSSCRNGRQAKQVLNLVKEYSGKAVKASEKSKIVVRYGDDVARNIEFVKVQCDVCYGSGEYQGYLCENCDGDGYVYQIRAKD